MLTLEEVLAEAEKEKPKETQEAQPTWERPSYGDLLTEAQQRKTMREPEPGFTKVAAKGLLRSGYQMIGSIGSMAGWFNEMIGLDELAKGGFAFRKRWEDRINEGWSAPDPRVFEGRFWDKPSLKRAVGIIAETVPTLGAALAIGYASGVRWLGATALGLMEGAPEYEEMRKAGRGVGVSSVYGGIVSGGIAALEYLPIGHMLGAFEKFGAKSFAKGFWKGMGLGAVEEGLQEASQQVFQNWMAQMGYDDTRMLLEGVTEAIIGGAGAGGIAGGTVGKLQAWAEDNKDKVDVSKTIDEAQELVENQMETITGQKGTPQTLIDRLSGEFDREQEAAEGVDQPLTPRPDLAEGQEVMTPVGIGVIEEIDKDYVNVRFPGTGEATGFPDAEVEPLGVAEAEPVSEEPAIDLKTLQEKPTMHEYVLKRQEIHEPEVVAEAKKMQARLEKAAIPTPTPADETIRVDEEQVEPQRTAGLRNDPFFTEAWAKKGVQALDERESHIKTAFVDTETFMDSEFYDGSYPVPETGGLLAAEKTKRYKEDEGYRAWVDKTAMDMAQTIIDANKKRQILQGSANAGLFGVSYNIQQVEQTGKKVKGKYTVNVARAWNQEAKVKYPYVYKLGDISVREALQNSLDAVMRAKKLREVKDGKIEIEVLGMEPIPPEVDAKTGKPVWRADTSLAEEFHKRTQEAGGEITYDEIYKGLQDIAQYGRYSDYWEKEAISLRPVAKALGYDEHDISKAFSDAFGPIASGYTIDDNGIGMSDVDIADKFLALHGTGKDVEGEFGGFGIAKAVILGPSDTATWTLHTRDNYFTHEMATAIEEIGTTKRRQGTRLEVRTQDQIIDPTITRQYVETTRPPKGIKILYKYQDTPSEELGDPFKGKRRQVTKTKIDDNTDMEITYLPKPGFDYQRKMIIRLVGKTSGARLTQAIRAVNDEGFSGAIVVDITTDLTPSHADYPLDGSRMNFKGTKPKEAITKVINKVSLDKKSAARVGVTSRKYWLAQRPEWKKTLQRIKTDKNYQNLLKVISDIYDETGQFHGHGPRHGMVGETPTTHLPDMEVQIDVGAKKKGGSLAHAIHVTAYEAVARLLSVPIGAKVGKLYGLISKEIDGATVGAQYNPGTGAMGLNFLNFDKTALKNPTTFAQYLKSLVVHELTHAWVTQHDEDYSTMREQNDNKAAPYFDYILRIAEAALGKKSKLRKATVTKDKIVEKEVEVVVEREIEKEILRFVRDPEQMELFREQEIGGYGGYEDQIFLSPQSARQLRLFPTRDDRLTTGWGSTERIVGTRGAVQQPTAQGAPDTGEGRLRPRADLPDVFAAPPERRSLWRRVKNWISPRTKAQRKRLNSQIPDEMSAPWKKGIKNTPQYSLQRIERPVVTHYIKKEDLGKEPKKVMKVFLVSIPDDIQSNLKEGKPQIVFDNVEDARGHNVNPERLKDWLQLYDMSMNLKYAKDFWVRKKEGKLEGVIELYLTKGCHRVPTIIERVEIGILPPETHLEACYEGMCFVNYKQYSLYGQIENMEVRDLQMADPDAIANFLKRANIANLNDTPFLREGALGDSSHALATDAAEAWLHEGRKRGITVPTVFISSGYGPVSDERYQRLGPYADRFVLHFSTSGWFPRNEIMMRLAEFQAARDAGLPAVIRVVTNRDQLPNRYGDVVNMRNEEFLFNQLGEMRVSQDELLETQYHDDTVDRRKPEHRSSSTGQFKHQCGETGRCVSCGAKCLVNTLLGGQKGKSRIYVPPQYSLERGKPPIKTVYSFNHVGAVEGSPNDSHRIQTVGRDLLESGIELGEELAHDHIDLGEGRDYLKEAPGADVTILHWIPDEGIGRVGQVGLFQISELHSIEKWREALLKSDSAFIYVFGGIDEISGEKLGDLPGYTREKVGPRWAEMTRYTRNVPSYQMVDARDRFMSRRVSNLRARLEEVATQEADEALIKHDIGIPFYDEFAEWPENQNLPGGARQLKARYIERFGELKTVQIGKVQAAIGSRLTRTGDIRLEDMYDRLKRQAQIIGWVAVQENEKLFKTGTPVTFQYVRNTEKAPDMGERFQQHLEPAGSYMLHNPDPGDLPGNWKAGTITLRSPLVIKFHSVPGEARYNENSWKANLSRAYGGMTGWDLSRTLMAEGFDSIVTVGQTLDGKPMDTREIIYLGPTAHYLRGKAQRPTVKSRFTRITTEDLQTIFPGQKIGVDGDGNIWIETKAGHVLKIQGVEEITPDSYGLEVAYGQTGLEGGERILGEYASGQIKLQRDAAGRFTLAHESIHWLEDMGILSSKDIAIIKGTIKRLYKQGKFEPVRNRDGSIIDLGGPEDRANYLASQILEQPTGAMAQIVKKIQDFIDRLVNLVQRTSHGIIRDIKTGAIYDNGIASGHAVNLHGVAQKSGPIWTSQMTEWVIKTGPNKATADQWLKTLERTANKGQHFKKEEYDWSGIKEWLESLAGDPAQLKLWGVHDRISKEQVVQWLAAHNIKIEETAMVDYHGSVDSGAFVEEIEQLEDTYDILREDEGEVGPWAIDFRVGGTPWGEWHDQDIDDLREHQGEQGYPQLSDEDFYALERYQEGVDEEGWDEMSVIDLPVPYMWEADTPLGTYRIHRKILYKPDGKVDQVVFDVWREGYQVHEFVFDHYELWDQEQDEVNYQNLQENLDYALHDAVTAANDDFNADFHTGEATGSGARYEGRDYLTVGEYGNYQEILLKIPTIEARAKERYEDAKDAYHDYIEELAAKYTVDAWVIPDVATDEENSNLLRLQLTMEDAENFASRAKYKHGHWSGESNFVVHVRFNERVDADGKRTLFIEEIQSDWHQDARKLRNRQVFNLMKDGMSRAEAEAAVPQNYGYQDHSAEQRHREARDLTRKIQADLGHKYEVRNFGSSRLAFRSYVIAAGATEEEIDRFDAATREELWWNERVSYANPHAPLKTGYTLVAMKRMIRWAAEHGYERVAWTPGWIQVDRWSRNLRRTADKISWQKEYTTDWTPAKEWSREIAGRLNQVLADWWRVKSQDIETIKNKFDPQLHISIIDTHWDEIYESDKMRLLQEFIYENPAGLDSLNNLLPNFGAKADEYTEKYKQIERDEPTIEHQKDTEIRWEYDHLRNMAGSMLQAAHNWEIPMFGPRPETRQQYAEQVGIPVEEALPPEDWVNDSVRTKHRNLLWDSMAAKMMVTNGAWGGYTNTERMVLAKLWQGITGEAFKMVRTGKVRIISSKNGQEGLNTMFDLEGQWEAQNTFMTLEGLLGKEVYRQIKDSAEDVGEIVAEEGGEPLTIGGEAFKNYYDKMVKKATNSFITAKTRDWNSKGVETTTIYGDAINVREYNGPEYTIKELWDVYRQQKEDKMALVGTEVQAVANAMAEHNWSFQKAMDHFGTPLLAKALGGSMVTSRKKPIKVHAFDVTPEMAESAMKGLPMYHLLRKSSYPEFIQKKFDVEPKSIINRIKEAASNMSENWRQLLVDRLDPIKEHLGDYPYMLHRLTTGLPATIAMYMRHGKVEWDKKSAAMTVNTTNQGFLTWLEKLPDDHATKLLYWVAAKRAEYLDTLPDKRRGQEGKTLEKWLDADTRQEIFDWVGEDERYWEGLNEQLQEWNKSVLDLATEAGLINEEAREAWEQHYYLPFFRIMEDPQSREKVLGGPQQSARFISSQIFKLYGAEMKLGNPLENLVRMWTHLIHESQRNVARASAFYEAQKLAGDGPPVLEEVSFKDIHKFYTPPKKEGKGGGRMTFVTADTKEPVLAFLKNGKRVYFKVHDPTLYQAMSNMNAQRFTGWVMDGLRGSKRLLTGGATFSIGFRIRNMLRDTLHVAIVSKSFRPFIDSMTGFAKAMREDEDYVKFMASMGGFGSSYVSADDPKALARYIDRIIEKEGKEARTRIIDTAAKAWNFWDKIGAASENAARVQLYANLRKKGVSHLEAAFQARDLLDFTMRGDAAAIQLLISIVPFMNARTQGIYKLGRAFGENRAGFMLKGLALTAASLILWGWNRDKEEYKELEDWDKWNYYHFWVGSEHYRLPKPFEVGAIFSSMFESAADTLTGDEDVSFMIDWLIHTMRDNLNLIAFPAALGPLAEQWANKVYYTRRPIVPMRLERLPAGYQREPWTPIVLQLLGQKLGISPRRAEAFLKGYLASYVQTFFIASDMAFRAMTDWPEKPRRVWEDIPTVGQFVRRGEPARRTKYETRFYELFREVDEIYNLASHYRRTGDIEKARAVLERDKEKLRWRKPMLKAKARARKISNRIRYIIESREMSRDEKRERIDELAMRRNELMKLIYNLYTERGR